ncbi:hypothetical protein Kfla_5404 [Kribbella flavida DSM 17836]|uniref:Uncharacterized protein n=1 Tax=Kribbella flavida (strain DSM 17836 / JCM 10339 / NBRC 14399) TaxID=479435 RepID=D2PM49_KRIFD|nr:hypothetical protein [Kribbella flavida]ADB34417.1 hypothetical protein Kfla_5404 [Kribbella flavida DSM 17836]
MNEHDLHERMRDSTAWTDHLGTEPAADLLRGRKRLRRRRTTIGASAMSAIAVVAAGATIAAGQLPGAADGQVAGDPTPGVFGVLRLTPGGPTITCPLSAAPPGGLPAGTAEPNHLRILVSHVDPARTHLKGRSAGILRRPGDGPCEPRGVAAAWSEWHEAGGTGFAAVAVRAKGDYGPVEANEIPEPRADVCGLYTDRSTFTDCRVITTAAGQKVRVGTRGKQAYWASYVRPDGAMAYATVEGDNRRADPGPAPADEPDPVLAPSVTLEALIATVTDPALDTY